MRIILIEICTAAGNSSGSATGSAHKMTLKSAIERGLREEANSITSEMIQEKDGLEIINEELIPALNTVGEGFEKGTVFFASATDEC